MNVLVINAGSSSLKYQLIDMDDESVLAKGVADRIGAKEAFLKHSGKKDVVITKLMPTHNDAVKLVLEALVNPEYGVIKNVSEINAIGHRIVGSGEVFPDSALVTDATIRKLRKIRDLCPLHMDAHIMGIKGCLKAMPGVPNVVVFDTTFHNTMPDVAKLYAIPLNDYKKYQIRRYGAHGTSHRYVSEVAAKIMGKKSFKLVVCHLGNGASLSCVKDGKCIDTSMGLTPLEGLVMGTRSGDIDASVVEYLCNKKGYDVHEAVTYLNKSSGLKGLCGYSDFRDLIAQIEKGNKNAKFAVDMFCYRVKKYIGAYSAVMNGLDFIAFTAGIGEHTPEVREKVLSGLDYLGVKFDKELNKNAKNGEIVKISTDDSSVKVYIIPTNEEIVIARETVRLSK